MLSGSAALGPGHPVANTRVNNIILTLREHCWEKLILGFMIYRKFICYHYWKLWRLLVKQLCMLYCKLWRLLQALIFYWKSLFLLCFEGISPPQMLIDFPLTLKYWLRMTFFESNYPLLMTMNIHGESEWPMFVDIESQHAGDMFENVVDNTCRVSMKIICRIFGSFAAKPWTRRLTVDNSWKYSLHQM